MKKKSSLSVICLTLTISLFLSSCDNSFLPEMGEGAYDTKIELEKRSYDLSNESEDHIMHVNFVNQSDDTLYILTPGTPTLQRLVNNEWKDLGQWYYVLAIVQQFREIAPGDSLGFEGVKLDLRSAARDWGLIQSAGYYRIHFAVYSEKSYEALIPEADRVTEPFEVIPW